jgi:hypothetical protein
MNRVFRKCGNVNVSQPYGPLWPVTWITLLFFLLPIVLCGLKHLRPQQSVDTVWNIVPPSLTGAQELCMQEWKRVLQIVLAAP